MHLLDDLGNVSEGASYAGGSFQSIVNVLTAPQYKDRAPYQALLLLTFG